MSDAILLQRDGYIATVTLNKPEVLNALDRAMWQRLGEVMRELSADETLRCVVIRGAGDKAFAAGADIRSFAAERADVAQTRIYHEALQGALYATVECRHPVVALIQGVCVGAGLELASACDMRICGTSSRFGVPIKRLGHTMVYGELGIFVDLVGPAVAKEILLEGQIFDAERAREMGLVNRIVEDGKVAEEAYATANRIAEGAPLAARWHKKFIQRLLDPAPLSDAEIAESMAAAETEDYREGVAAFLEKRKPDFKGR